MKEQCCQEREEKRHLKEAERERRKQAQEKVKQKLQEEQVAHDTGGSECALGSCEHRRARNWVQCIRCELWFHCLCVDVSRKLAESEGYYVFTCINCTY